MARYYLYIIPIPISPSEYNRAQTYVIAKGTANRSQNSVITLKNERYTKKIEIANENDLKETIVEEGIYTYKQFRLERIIPKNVRWLIPKPCLKLFESCHNAFPHTLTTYFNEGAPKRFHLAVETWVKPFIPSNLEVSSIPRTIFNLDGLAPKKIGKKVINPREDLIVVDISSSVHLANKKEKRERIRAEKLKRKLEKHGLSTISSDDDEEIERELAEESTDSDDDLLENDIKIKKTMKVKTIKKRNTNMDEEISDLHEGENIVENQQTSANDNPNSTDLTASTSSVSEDVVDEEVEVNKGPFANICENWFVDKEYMSRFTDPKNQCSIVYKLVEVNTAIPGQKLIEDFIVRKFYDIFLDTCRGVLQVYDEWSKMTAEDIRNFEVEQLAKATKAAEDELLEAEWKKAEKKKTSTKQPASTADTNADSSSNSEKKIAKEKAKKEENNKETAKKEKENNKEQKVVKREKILSSANED